MMPPHAELNENECSQQLRILDSVSMVTFYRDRLSIKINNDCDLMVTTNKNDDFAQCFR